MEALAHADIELVQAHNPGPFTLDGTNTWLVGRDPCWVVDPGPPPQHAAGPDAHLQRVLAGARERGGVGGIAITHDHSDHAGATAALVAAVGELPVVAVRQESATIHPADGDRVGPFEVIVTPGHATDHVVYLADRALFSGDAVLGHGSVFVWPTPGALTGYLAALDRLIARDLDVICPGHGPVVLDPRAKLVEYRDHRLDRERRLRSALDAGERTIDGLLDRVWSDAPAVLRPAAAVTLAAHLDKLDEEGRLPPGVERPRLPPELTAP